MKRKALHLLTSKDGKRAIYIDADNAEEIITYLTQSIKHKKKWSFISQIILENHRNTDVFDKEDINEKCKDIYAMKFFKGGDNDRIYCKQVSDNRINKYIIVASELYLKKKTQKNSAKEITIIERVATYEYECE